jgi:hypothetical protein
MIPPHLQLEISLVVAAAGTTHDRSWAPPDPVMCAAFWTTFGEFMKAPPDDVMPLWTDLVRRANLVLDAYHAANQRKA